MRHSAILASLISIAAPAAAQATGALPPMPEGTPWWVGWAISAGGPVLLWLIYAIGRTGARALSAALRAHARQLLERARGTPDKTDDHAADVQAKSLEAAADEIDKLSERK